MAAAMGGVDGLVFAGGAGENWPRIRPARCEGSAILGISIEQGLHVTGGEDCQTDVSDLSTALLAGKSREDLQIAPETRQLLN